MDDPWATAAITRLAAALGAPILADGLANLRVGPHDRSHVIARTATLVRAPAFVEAHVPDVILRFGGTPTARSTLEWLARVDAEHIVVDDGGWDEPTLRPSLFVDAEPAQLAQMLADANDIGATTDPDWLDAWCRADARADQAIINEVARITDRGEAFEGDVFTHLADALPFGTLVWVGSSMPVRDLDTFLPADRSNVRFLANRGANGIDGVVSSALGASVASDAPVVLVIGDLSFLHDLNALATARIPDVRLTIVLVDNDGGGIFSVLPQATAERPEVGLPGNFERLLGTPHGTDLGGAAHALGAEVIEMAAGEIGATIARAVGRPGIRVLRLRTDRARNVELHRRVLDAAIRAIG
jgi:2-succinyl-5-enolpyruvyl-6-hydroxy-3-cyclohexene-1-carboxylate synthase